MKRISESAKVSANVAIVGAGQLIIGAHSVIEPNVFIDLGVGGVVKIGARTKVKYGCAIRSYDGVISIGDRSTIGEYTILAGHGGLTIGHTVIISGHCYFSAADHIYHAGDPIRFQGETAKGIDVASGAWIGAQVVILDGVCIGENTIVGAGSVVTKSMGSNMICFGAPCRERKAKQSNQQEIAKCMHS